MIRYSFNEELNVLEVFYSGDIYLKDLIEYGEMIRESISFPRDLRILTDATKANYLLKPDEVRLVKNIMKEQIKPYKTVKTAVFHQKPFETAMSFILKNEAPIDDYQHDVFSTREAALDWLIN